jgi:hypothetical protein
MARKSAARRGRERPRLGKLSPLYAFFLNPFRNVRFTTSCPGCSGKTKQRKLPLAIHVHDWGILTPCASCLLIVVPRGERGIVSLRV